MLTTKQNLTVDTQKRKRKKSKHATVENHHIAREDSKRGGGDKGTTRQPGSNEMQQ